MVLGGAVGGNTPKIKLLEALVLGVKKGGGKQGDGGWQMAKIVIDKIKEDKDVEALKEELAKEEFFDDSKDDFDKNQR